MSEPTRSPQKPTHQHLIILFFLVLVLIFPFRNLAAEGVPEVARHADENGRMVNNNTFEVRNTENTAATRGQPSPFEQAAPLIDPEEIGMTRESLPSDEQFPSPSQDFSCKSVTGVGDSLMVGAAPYLQSGLNSFNYKARVGIQMDEGISYLRSLAAQDQIGDILLVSLGSNGPISSGQVDTVMELAGNRRVYAMNIVVARSWESSVNRVWAEGADRHRNLHIVDWHAYVGSHPGILRADGVHPTSSGYAAYAQLYLEEIPDSCKP